jgi:hypothetical protein
MLLKKVLKSSPIMKDPDVRWVDIDSVKPQPGNAMMHDSKGVDELAMILSNHEQRTPLEVWTKNSTIYKGNGTWLAMKKLGKKMIKVQFEEFDSEPAAIAYGLADNKAHEYSQWDPDALAVLLKAEEMKPFINKIGFKEEELQGLLEKSNIEKVKGLKETDTGIKATIKIYCRPEDRDELREILTGWSKECGFEEVIVK